MMQKRNWVPAALLVLLALSTTVWAQQGYQLKAVTDRPEALYHVGETASFVITLSLDGAAVKEGAVSCVLSNDGENPAAPQSVALTGEPVTVTGSRDKPGFLRCVVSYAAPDGKTYEATAGAGFDPEQIRAGVPAPDDFDAFWAGKKAELAKVPMNPVLTPVKAPKPGIECFDLQADCLGGAPVSGYYVRPVGAAPKSLPAILLVHGAGVGSSTMPDGYALKGMIALDINAHGIPNGQPAAFYEELNKGSLKDYRYAGRESRETYYFLGMYLRLVRALDFLTAQPEWDGRELFVCGGSQGGGQSIVAAGLDPRVTAIAANVPAMCDHTDLVNGWPRLVPRDAEGKPDPVVQEVSRYFDAVNFAARTKAEALVGVGFIDNTCRPTSVYAAYNNFQGKKFMLTEPLMTHATPPGWYPAVNELIKRRTGKTE